MTIKITKKIISFLGVTALAATLLLLPLVVAHAQGTGPPDIITPADTVWERCGLSDFGSCLQWFGVWITEKISLGLLTIGAWILWLGGVVLDEVLRYTVVEMSTRIGEGGLQTMINEVWRVARDFSNMFFVFILLYGAIVTVLGRDDINVRKVIRNVVIVAILINFSLLFTKIIIDVSNATTVVFYNRILQDVPAGSVENGGISVAFMNRFGLTSLWDPSTAERVLNSNAGGSVFKFFMLGLFGLVFMSVAAFVFFAIAMLFITRYLTLLFLLVLSPLAFAAMALPKDKYSDDWKKALMNQAIFAPVCMAMLWISLRILSVVVATPPDLGGVFIAAAGSVGTDAGNPAVSILNFIIAIGSIIAVLIVAQKTGAKGADGWLKRGKKWSVGLRKNMQSVVGRNTVGWAGNKLNDKLAKSETFNRLATTKTPALKIFGKTVVPQFGVGRLADSARKATVQNLAEQKFGGAYSRVSRDKEKKEQNTAIKENLRKAEIGNLIRDTKQLTAEERATLPPDKIRQREEQYQELTQTLSKISNKELEGIKAKDLAPHISLLNTRQLEHVLDKSDKFNEEDKEKLRDARFKPIRDSIEKLKNEAAERVRIAGIVDPVQQANELTELEDELKKARKQIQDLASKEIELAGAEFVSEVEFIDALKQSQLDSLTKGDNNNFTPGQRDKMKAMRTAALAAAVTGTGPRHVEALKKIKDMNGEALAKLPTNILTNREVMETFTKQKLMKLSEKTDDTTKLQNIKQEILREAGRAGANPGLVDIGTWLNTPSGGQFF